MTNSRTNLHATGVVLGRQGFLIMGPSGSGKSQLARTLLHDADGRGMFSALISDDQVWLEAQNARLIAHHPETIKGLMEIRFSGIVRMASVASAVIDAVIVLEQPERMPERLPQNHETIAFFSSITLPVLRLYPAHSVNIATLESLLADRNIGSDQPCPL